jgi:alpha-galactosidase
MAELDKMRIPLVQSPSRVRWDWNREMIKPTYIYFPYSQKDREKEMMTE